MFKLKRPVDERGVSVVLGAALVIAIIISTVSAFLAVWIPDEMRRREREHMESVEESLRELKTTMEGLEIGESETVDIKMSADSIPLIFGSSGGGTLSVFPSDIHTVEIDPIQDAYVLENSLHTNFGLEDLLRVTSRRNNNSRAFLKFPLENVPVGVTIWKAELWVYCDDYASPISGVTDVRCHRVDNDDWYEDLIPTGSIDWSNQPPVGGALDDTYVDRIGWISLTVKDFVAQEAGGDRIVSLGLIARQENYNDIERYVSFFSKEAGDKKPYLRVMYTPGPPRWRQTDWDGEQTYPTHESGKWYEDYDNYYENENINAGEHGEIRLENAISLETDWTQDTKEEFEAIVEDNENLVITADGIKLQSNTTTFGNAYNVEHLKNIYPYKQYTYIQRADPGGEYAAPCNGWIIQWSWNPGENSTQGAKFKIFRHVKGSTWTLVGESGPEDIGPGLTTVDLDPSDYIPVKENDRIGMYSGDTENTCYPSVTDNYYITRTQDDITQGTSAFNDHPDRRRLPIEATIQYYLYSGTFTSLVHYTGVDTSWRTISWGESLPPGTDITFQIRVGNTPVPDENWSDWSYRDYTNNAGEAIILPRAQYIQYRAHFSTNDTAHTPVLHWVKIEYITSAEYEPSGQLDSSVYDAGSSVEWQTITWEAETPNIVGENKPVDAEPDPMVDWSPLIGENLSPFEYTQAQDDIYENIAEDNRIPWWNRSWAYRRPVTVNNEDIENTWENYQVKVEVDYADNMQSDFDDLRFVDNDNSTQLEYWIENYNTNDSAVVWVKVPSIPANDDKMFYMYYGNPGARSASDFFATFPNHLIIDGTSEERGGVRGYDWVEIKNGGILGVQGENILELSARKIIVGENSHIYAIGSGYPGGPPNFWHEEQENGTSHDPPGTGHGTGGYALGSSDGPGGGGGAYGGSGGDGGGAKGNNDYVYPGEGGENFGSAEDNSVYMGSGGGSGGLSKNAPEENFWNIGGAGGAGGGAVRLYAGIIEISGTVSADGGDGAGGMSNQSDAGSGGGGGGSGGAILIEGSEVIITGTLSVEGGTGGAKSPITTGKPYGGAGGGGGGGRIKVFYDKSFDNTSMTHLVDGGDSGGPSYADPVAQPGTSGTYYSGTISYPVPTTSLGPETQQSEAGEPLGYYLNWEHRVTDVRLGYENYTFHIWGYSDTDENIGVYIWKSSTGSWAFINNLPKSSEDSISFNIPPENLSDYLIGENLSIGYFDDAGDETRTFIHIDYCVLECTGQFSTEVKVYTKTGGTENVDDDSWSRWENTTNGGEVPSPAARYLQYRVELSTERGKLSPVFKEITINYLRATEYGTTGFDATNQFYPDQTYVYEGGTVILIQDGVDLMIARPTMITVSETENENLIRVDVNFWMIENRRASSTSTGTGTVEVFCRDSSYTVVPVDGPNCENLIIEVWSPYRNAWRTYLRDLHEELSAMNIGATFNESALTLIIMGRGSGKDIYYYEKVTEIEVTVR